MALNKLFATLAIFFVVGAAALAQQPGDLVVTPTRAELSDQARSTDITLVNRSNRTLRYRLSFMDMEMSDDGVLKKCVETPKYSVVSMIRLAPREVQLGPGQSQRVKVLVTFPAGTPDGEYRSHLSFDCLTDPTSSPVPKASSDSISINLRLRTIVTIPVIARHGSLSATTTISDAALTNDGHDWFTKFRINRDGNRSVRGDVLVQFVSNGKATVLGKAKSLPVYFPNTSRNVSVKLEKDPKSLGQGHIEIKFAEPGRKGATAESVLPGK